MTSALRYALPLAALASVTASSVALAAGPPKDAYEDNCSACHQVTGKGIKGAFPALAASPLVTGPAPVLVSTVLNGRAGMPAFKDDLSDAELSGILTYIRASWGNKASAVTPADVARVRKAPPKARGLQAH
ncbi:MULTISPECIES: c-type cytochrome [unclassified Caulobacter]|uniref:c-type cytochrome n=1 Tax=unclassified Caulobacter TaxID=2648921 RepID=UPI000D37B5A2|nr:MULTISPECIES: cytochrome c [unclassified Caulobacter]PTS87775.1 cytochrome C [Caulobacter sp. HMWF009]PTT05308.1 cytochrome C [Caulobacter sp. HMWF025]